MKTPKRKGWRYGRINRRTLFLEIRRGEVELTTISQTGSRHYVTLPRDVWIAMLRWAVPLSKRMPSSVDSLEHLAWQATLVDESKKKRRAHSNRVLSRPRPK